MTSRLAKDCKLGGFLIMKLLEIQKKHSKSPQKHYDLWKLKCQTRMDIYSPSKARVSCIKDILASLFLQLVQDGWLKISWYGRRCTGTRCRLACVAGRLSQAIFRRITLNIKIRHARLWHNWILISNMWFVAFSRKRRSNCCDSCSQCSSRRHKTTPIASIRSCSSRSDMHDYDTSESWP